MKKILAVLALALASCTAAPAWAQGVNMTNVARYTASYKSTTSMAANTADTVFAAGSNTKGAVVWSADFTSANAGTAGYYAVGYLAKTSAPATAIDGDVIVGPNSIVSVVVAGTRWQPVFIPAGKGLYFISTLAENAGGTYRNVLYTLLQ